MAHTKKYASYNSPYVMDVQKAIALVNRLEDTECLIIKKNDQIYQPYV